MIEDTCKQCGGELHSYDGWHWSAMQWWQLAASGVVAEDDDRVDEWVHNLADEPDHLPIPSHYRGVTL